MAQQIIQYVTPKDAESIGRTAMDTLRELREGIEAGFKTGEMLDKIDRLNFLISALNTLPSYSRMEELKEDRDKFFRENNERMRGQRR